METENVFVTIAGIVLVTLIGCMTYFNVIESNNNKEIVTRAIERGIDPVVASCAANINTSSRDIRSTCEKVSIIKGK
jgi:tryptophan synthase alpha subunit